MKSSNPSLTRRRMLTIAGVGAAAVAVPALPKARAASSPELSTAATADACSTDTASQEVGPFYVADGLVRTNITAGEDGVPLSLTLTVMNATTCDPLAGAAVDVWHANALGVYSDESSENTVGETYLRGVQVTDGNGQVTFTSIVPGWYAGRTNHYHLRVYTGGTVSGTTYSYTGATLVYTGQMFFDPALDSAVAAVAPYTSNPNSPRTLNSADRVYTQQNGDETLITTTGSVTDGYTGTLTVTVTGSGTQTGADATSLTLTASKSELHYGKKLTLSGVLLDTTTSGGLADQDITLTAVLNDGTKASVVVESGVDGAWTYTHDATATATYTASYAGNSSYAAATSTSAKVRVKYRLVLSDVSPTASAHKPVTVTGSLAPAEKGVVVTVRRIGSNGKHHRLATTTTNHHGHWSAQVHLAKGKHKIDASVPDSELDDGDTSRTVTVHRT